MATKQILILEDNVQLLRLYTRVLENDGYLVQAVTTVKEAEYSLQANDYEVFICDIHVSDDIALPLLEAWTPALKRRGTQVVIVTGNEQYREFCEDLGIDFFMQKPIEPQMIHTLVSRLSDARTAGV